MMTDTCGPSGSASSASAGLLVSSANKSPDQTRLEKEREYSRKYRLINRARDLVRHAKRRAEKKGLPFDLNPHIDAIQERISRGCCELTGISFDLTSGLTWNSPSIDRKDPSKGYVISNVRVVLHAVNSALGTWGEQKLLEISRAILAQRRQISMGLSMLLGERFKKNTSALGSTLFKLTWDLSATPSGSPFYRLRASARPTSASASTSSPSGSTHWPTTRSVDSAKGALLKPDRREGTGHDLPTVASWATPAAREAGGTPEQFLARKEKARENGAELGISLTSLALQAQLAGWPTTTRQDSASSGVMGYESSETHHSGMTLTDAARLATWPTPNCTTGQGGSIKHMDGRRSNLIDTVMLAAPWRTPTSLSPCKDGNREAGDSCNLREMRLLLADPPPDSGTHATGSPAGTGSSGQLSPEHSRWLMGLPPEWGSCAPTGTRSLRRSPRNSSARSSRSSKKREADPR